MKTPVRSVFLMGGSGRAGSWILRNALERGLQVKALMRDPSRISLQHPLLEIIRGDVQDAALLKQHIRETDAVVSALGDRNLSGPITLLSQAAQTISDAMQQSQNQRLIVLAGAGILQHSETQLLRDQPEFPPFLRNISEDHLRVFTLLRKGDLLWTMVCPPQITHDAPTGNFETRDSYFPHPGNQISAGDLAAFILDELNQNRFLRTRVGITSR